MRTTALAALAVMSLSACSDNDGPKVAKGICTPFAPAAATPANTAGVPTVTGAVTPDGAMAVEDCLHRWAYSLAGAKDSADVVAQSVVAACSPALSKWNLTSLAPPPGATGAPPPEATSLISGEPINAMVAHREFAEGRALFFVVQARAGHCAPPPPAKS